MPSRREAPRAKESLLAGVIWLLSGLIWLLAGCAGPFVAEPGTQSCWPAFPYRDGWLGGDAAYSIPLSASETVWLFGDSFVGAPGQADRKGASFVHNSVGVSRCRAGGLWEIEYAWGRSEEGAAQAFLERGQPDAWWWLFDGFVHSERLYLGLLEVERAPPAGPLAMPFAFTGVQLARIPNPHDDPASWRMELVALSAGSDALPAGAMVVKDSHVYFFTFLERGNGEYPRALARLPLRALDGKTLDVSTSLEYLAQDGTWKPGLDPADARVLMDDAATEMSVRFHDGLGRWLALYNYPDVGDSFPETRPADAVWVRTAERLEGPWSERRMLFRIPELDPSYAGGYDPNTGCYAAKEHPQFSSGGRVTFTYVCNLFTGRGQDPMQILGRLLVDMGLYRPIPVAVELPPEL
jgi:hypothetical protein